MWSGLYSGNPEDLVRPEADELKWKIRLAQTLDDELNREEQEAKREAEMEHEFGPRWWLRAHP